MGTPRMMIALVAATGVVVGAIAALALQSWWVLIALLLLHAVVTTSVVVYTLRRAGESHDKPDPVTEARIRGRAAVGAPRRPASPRPRGVQLAAADLGRWPRDVAADLGRRRPDLVWLEP
jgi:hypothetical protein